MKKHTLFISLIISYLLLFPPSASASNVVVRPYLLTEARELYGTPHLSTVIYKKLLNIGYRSGKVVLSSTPDGTGPISVPDDVVVNVTYPGAESFRVNPPCPSTSLPPLDISHVLWKSRTVGYANLSINFTYLDCKQYVMHEGVLKNYAKIEPMYLVHFDDYDSNAPTPFLELPWDYKADGKSFSDAALLNSAYFDHEYPLLSTSLSEPNTASDTIIKYSSPVRIEEAYSSHDGYDWALLAGAKNDDPILAAAAGNATFVNSCKPCGNAIHIDHGNGYQTRYYHLQSEGLVTADPSQVVPVTAGQQIGKVGYSGNVIPQGNKGAHIHFMVIQDKNADGNFEDNIPDGIVDPFGWQSDEPDPWEHYTFEHNGQQKIGATSHYLWKSQIPMIAQTLTATGGTFSIENLKVYIPKNTVSQDSVLTMNKISPRTFGSLTGIKAVEVTIKDGFGNILSTFQQALTLVLNVTSAEISRFKPESVAIYSSTDGETWQKEATQLNTINGEAQTQVNHLTQFALMGEKKDAIPPTTTLTLTGTEGPNKQFISLVTLELQSSDEPQAESLGVDYTYYKINDDGWKEYTGKITVSDAGIHLFSYYSVDNDGNQEEIKTKEFTIDYTPLTPTPTNTPTPTPTSALRITPTSTTAPSRIPTPTPRANKKPTKPFFCTLLQKPKVIQHLSKHAREQLKKLCVKQSDK